MDTGPIPDRPDPRFPRTERAFNAGQDWAGIWAAEQVTRMIANARPDTRQLLKPAIRRLQDAVERLCPVTLQATPHGVAVGYGPILVGRDIAVVAASPRHYAGFHIPAWPESDDTTPRLAALPRHALWATLAECIDAGNIDGILQLLAARYSAPEFALLDQHAAEIRRAGHTPVAAVLAGRKKLPNGKIAAAGITNMISLPPGSEVQVADAEGTA
jgi:hypothetical protein